MRIAVVGATGRIGSRVVAAAERRGHETVGISRSTGADVLTGGDALVAALTGADAVVDTTSTDSLVESEVREFFSTETTNLLAAEQQAGVRHHVLLSIVGMDRPTTNPHYAGKRAQEELVEKSPVPWTIVPATQFHDLPEMVSTWNEHDGVAEMPPLLLQPIAPDDIAEVLAEIAAGEPQGRYRDVAGPNREDAVDLARRTRAARGTSIRLIPTWGGAYDLTMSGNALLPGDGARIEATTFEQWLAQETA